MTTIHRKSNRRPNGLSWLLLAAMLPVCPSLASAQPPGDTRDPCATLAQLRSEGMRAVQRELESYEVTLELARFGPHFQNCTVAEGSAWGFVADGLRLETYERPDETTEIERADLEWSLVLVDHQGGVTARQAQTPLRGFGQFDDEALILGSADLDRDGVPELHYRRVEPNAENTEEQAFLVTASDGEVRDFALFERSGIRVGALDRIEDVDGDGLHDLVVHSLDAGLQWCEAPEDPWEEPDSETILLLLHGTGEGSFTATDPVAFEFARAQCGPPVPPPGLADRGHGRFALCAPVWQVEAASWIATLGAQCAEAAIDSPDTCHEVCASLDRLQSIALGAHPLGGTDPFQR